MSPVTILPKSSPSPEPHQRKTKERRADISSISSFMIYNSKRQREEIYGSYYTPLKSGWCTYIIPGPEPFSVAYA